MATTARKTTLLDLLFKLQDERPCSERTLVRRAIRLLRSGRVVLCGVYRNAQSSFK